MSGTQSVEPRRAPWRNAGMALGVALLLVGAGGVAWWGSVPPDPQDLLRNAAILQDRDPTTAEKLLRRSIDVSGGKFPEGERALCEFLARRGDWDAAAALYAGLEAGERPLAFLMRYGTLASRASRFPEAIASLTEVYERRAPEAVQALDALFAVYVEQQDLPKVFATARALARLEPDRPERWWDLLRMLDTQERRDVENAETLREALSHDLPAGDKLELRHRLVGRLVKIGDAAAARAELGRLAELDGASPRVQVHEAAILRLESRPQEALAVLQSVGDDADDRPGLIRLRAMIHLDLGNYAAAVADFRRGLEDAPFDLVGHFKLVEAYRGQGNLKRAREHEEFARDIREKRWRINKLRDQARGRPPDRRLYQELADLYRELNEPETGLIWERRAHEAPESPE
ncbi:MAG: tetratricopeptide repeat protein [Planctomycetaceae bacterium]|nr:tetratricopeptide repeat protein [Planctomycetaceae bacterium]